MKKALLALAVAGAAVSAQADVTLYGATHVSVAENEEFSQDSTGTIAAGNDNLNIRSGAVSASRFGLRASKEVGSVTITSVQEIALPEDGNGNPYMRKNELIASGDFGTFSGGQGSTATDGISEQYFTSTWATWNGLSNYGPGSTFGPQGEFGIYSYIDGGREERLRYDTPRLGGIATVSVDLQDDGGSDVSIRLGNANFLAGLGHRSRDADDADVINGSLAIKAGIFTASYHFGTQDGATATTSENEWRAFNIGLETATYGLTLDVQTNETDSNRTATQAGEVSTTGLNFSYKPASGVLLYAGIRKVEADTPSATAQANGITSLSGNGATAGARITF